MKRLAIIAVALFFYGTSLAEINGSQICPNEPARNYFMPLNSKNEPLKAKLSAWKHDAEKQSYTSEFYFPIAWLNRQVLLRLATTATAIEVAINGKVIAKSAMGGIPLEYNITKYAKDGLLNTITIRYIESHNDDIVTRIARRDATPQAEVISQPTLRIRDVICNARANDSGDIVAEFAVVMKCNSLNPKSSKISYKLHLGDSLIVTRGTNEITLDMMREDTLRFMARIPRNGMWSKNMPQMATLNIDNIIDGRIAERMIRPIGLRAVAIADGEIYVNHTAVKMHLADYNGTQSIDTLVKSPINGVVVPLPLATEQLLDECDKRGIYVFVATPIDTTAFGDSIARGGNPTNDPRYKEAFAEAVRSTQRTVSLHASVVGYVLATGKTNGINIYDSYLLMKDLEPFRPVVYEGAGGEWCSDKIGIR